MKIKIKAVKNGVLDTQYGNGNYENNSVSFPIKWEKVKNAKSYAITLVDKEATKAFGVPFIHWIIADLKKNKLDWDFSFREKDNILQFENSMTHFAKNHILDRVHKNALPGVFIGPFPIESDHNYELRVLALNVESILPKNFNKTSKPLFFDDFQNLIHNKVIDQGIYTFLYRTKFKVENGQIVPNNKSVEQLNAPLDKNQEFFYKNNIFEKINVRSSGIYQENGINYLNQEYVGKLENNFFVAKSMPLEFTSIKQAKSYVVALLGNAEVKTFATPTVFWVKTDIEPTLQETIIINSKEINEQFYSNNKKFHFINTFGSHFAPKIANMFNMSNEVFRFISNDYGLIKLPNISEPTGVYTLTVYALDQKIQFNERQDFDVITLGDVLNKMKNHVIAEGNLLFKIK
ncbi:YbhB/YbcL family Raf kinase inhibitor-like protein [Mesomycoplasma lagogenitalium]|uniref:YbhB/YbcL family Raf kinase inhibitor-like protein n=1 Tax=Mesomycoplasma lagogenitalium TaxID=171286 RepID=A0ABY8LVS3_9BACT|nr:YbhB/YbcL family Raf kinase inhibitor-like protein [Mesomycoplasma lagogenitalium]WGI36900.1 YbhB/YbcL family Raf kinase inhibitor-like protein [Mesomycoplasma lagogenitalium]